ncbi:MAG: SRPBCC family protein, partial [Ferruginibacter sp.]
KGDVSIHINAPVSQVWEALTTPEIIKQYFFGTDTITDWKVGNPIRFTGEWEGKKYEDKGTILINDPETQLSFDYWSSMSGTEDIPENYLTITYDLVNTGNGTDLSVTQENIPDQTSKEHSAQNWKKVLEGLKNLLEHKQTPGE